MRGEGPSIQPSTHRAREATSRGQVALTGPVLKAETVTGDLPHCVGRCGLCCQQEVLIEVALLVAIKFYCPTCHYEDRGLALSSLLFTSRKSIKKTTQPKTNGQRSRKCRYKFHSIMLYKLQANNWLHIHKKYSFVASLLYRQQCIRWPTPLFNGFSVFISCCSFQSTTTNT